MLNKQLNVLLKPKSGFASCKDKQKWKKNSGLNSPREGEGDGMKGGEENSQRTQQYIEKKTICQYKVI